MTSLPLSPAVSGVAPLRTQSSLRGSASAALLLAVTLALLPSLLGAQQKAPSVAARAQAVDTMSALAGVVHDSAGAPLPYAQVFLMDNEAKNTTSDERGRFRLNGLSAGPARIGMRRIGFQATTFEIDFPPESIVSVDVKMVTAAVELGTIRVEGKTMDLLLFRKGFYSRMGKQAGKFVTPEQVSGFAAANISQVIDGLTGIKVARDRQGRGTPLGKIGAMDCALVVYLNGSRLAADIGPLDQFVNPRMVRAIEVYVRRAETPIEFQTSGEACGSLVIWTK
jgi:hypothetical protein